MEPTTWTPERALEWFRELGDKSIDASAFSKKWGGLHDEVFIAIAALESAAAEIERQKARADAAGRERDAYRKAKQENDERFCIERDEARAEVERLKAELAKAQQQHPAPTEGPSDERIGRQIQEIRFSGEEPQVRIDRLCLLLTDIAQRAGVRL